ncbi:MAG: cysteine desulfurase [Sandaracinus sp.]|nr:cysteine desulfurase [Sandaracinus sp.]MCB9623576.1 cysteine desulfurase [Sandaracinus sp.]MCB9636288.1 cysteine desulfurase [Sandaracinus sp.]
MTDEPLYLDHHATTPVDPRVLDAMLPFFRQHFGNASSRSHGFGAKARAAVEEARASVAAAIGARSGDLVFTSGATESDDLAIAGRLARAGDRDGLVVAATEHSAVHAPAERFAREGGRLHVATVDATGRVDLAALEATLDERTTLVSVALCQSEVGTIQDVAEVVRLAHAVGAHVHCDAAQGLGYVPFDVEALGVDLVSLSSHKIYGPKGVGALWVRRGVPLEPRVLGGGQEKGLRSGTLNVPGIVGFGAAATIQTTEGASEGARLRAMRDRLWQRLVSLEAVHLHGPALDAPRHPGNLHVGVEGLDGEGLLLALAPRFALSSGSACASERRAPSRALTAMGVPKDRATLRFGLGRETPADRIDEIGAHVVEVVERLRAGSPAWRLRDETLDW